MSVLSAVDIVAILFHRPLTPLPADGANHIDSTLTSSFLKTIQTISSIPAPIEYTSASLDDSTYSHVVRIAFSLPKSITLATLRTHPLLHTFDSSNSVETTLQYADTYSTPPRLVVFDMDSTLIQQEVIDLLASFAGVEAQVSSITARAMNGELDFSSSLSERVQLLQGLPESVFEELKPRITLTPGADTLLKCLGKQGVKTALLSGGFVPLARWVADLLSIDHVHANELAVDSSTGKLTGHLKQGCIVVDGARKRHLLQEIARAEGVTDARAIVAVGDGANDLPMLWEAGLGIAVNAKPKVQQKAPTRLNGKTALLDVLYMVGMTEDDIDKLAPP